MSSDQQPPRPDEMAEAQAHLARLKKSGPREEHSSSVGAFNEIEAPRGSNTMGLMFPEIHELSAFYAERNRQAGDGLPGSHAKGPTPTSQ